MLIEQRRFVALLVAIPLVLVPAPALAEDDPVTAPAAPTADPDPQPAPEPVTEPVPPVGEPTIAPPARPQPDDPAAGDPVPQDGSPAPAPDLGADPQEALPPQDDPGSSEAAHQAAIEKEKAQEAARKAVAEARAEYEKALAKHRLARYEVRDLLQRSEHAARRAAELRRTMGNLARMAYSSGNSDLNLFALFVESEDPQEVLAGAEVAERVAGHMETQWQDEIDAQLHSDDLAAEARTVARRAADDLAVAKKNLDDAMALAESVDLAVEPPDKTPPVDLTTESDWVFPTSEGSISSEAGMRMHPILHYLRCHEGADITTAAGTAIFAVDDGVVLSAGVNGGYGNYTLIAHGGGLTSAYAHQQQLFVEAGDRVSRGQLIGEVGTTGLSTGPHLHFEARYYGAPYNPRGWLEQKPELRVPSCTS